MTQTAATLQPLAAARQPSTLWQGPLRTARRKPLGAVSLVLILVIVALAIGADVVAPYGYNEPKRGHRLEAPSAQFLMGTDHLSRDILSRVIHGARVSLLVGLMAVALGTAGGAFFGLVSAYTEGWFDQAVQRVMEALMSLPSIVLALSIVAAIGPSLANVVVAIGLSQLPAANRVVRAVALAEKSSVYVEAAWSVGCGPWRVMLRHLLPNVTAPIIVLATVNLGVAIVAEASLSFLGVGTPDPIPSWGGMLSVQSQRYMLAQPWNAVWPGLAISLAVLAWNLLGDALRDVLDPRLRGYNA